MREFIGNRSIRTLDQVELDQIQRDMSWAKKRIEIVKSVGKKANLLPKIGYYMNEIPFIKSGKPKRKLISLKLNDYESLTGHTAPRISPIAC